jgi:hypothetical protein
MFMVDEKASQVGASGALSFDAAHHPEFRWGAPAVTDSLCRRHWIPACAGMTAVQLLATAT